jgi:hypothetical protein
VTSFNGATILEKESDLVAKDFITAKIFFNRDVENSAKNLCSLCASAVKKN